MLYAMYVGEEDSELFEEFVVSKEDLQIAEAGSAEQDGNSSKPSHTVSFDGPSALVTQLGLQLQSSPALCKKAPNHSSPRLFQQVFSHGSAPPLSPSIDGSPTASSSVTFAGMSAMYM